MPESALLNKLHTGLKGIKSHALISKWLFTMTRDREAIVVYGLDRKVIWAVITSDPKSKKIFITPGGITNFGLGILKKKIKELFEFCEIVVKNQEDDIVVGEVISDVQPNR